MRLHGEKKLDRLTASWKKKIAPHVPEGMSVDGVVSGGKGITHKVLFRILGAVLVVTILSGILLKSAGVLGIFIILIMLAVPNLTMILVAELGIYRSILIFWDAGQVTILEGGAFDRLIKRQTYSLPLAGGISWPDPGTVVIEGWEIHLDYPELCRHTLNQALGSTENNSPAAPLSPVGRKPEPSSVSGKRPRHVLMAANVCIAIGFIGWVGAFLCSVEDIGKWPLLADIQLPTGPAEVIADNKGNIYLISIFYRRIQKFDPTGDFLHGWHLSTVKGDHRYTVDRENQLHIFVGKGGGIHYLLDEMRGVVPFSAEKQSSLPQTPQEFRQARYKFTWWYIVPTVVKIDASGEGTVVVRIPFWLWPFTAPVPALLLVVVGILVAKRAKARNA